MTSFFPDLNAWIALSVAEHAHGSEAWNWLGRLPSGSRVVFARYTHLGLLRLLTNETVMGSQTLTLRKAWGVYDRWLGDCYLLAFAKESRASLATFDKGVLSFAREHGYAAISPW